MKYAIIQLQGKQYRVEEGQKLTVDRIAEDPKKKIVIKDVLLYTDGTKTLIGTPKVEGVTVQATVEEHARAKKIRVSTFKAKSRYRKTHGHRQDETTLTIDSISA